MNAPTHKHRQRGTQRVVVKLAPTVVYPDGYFTEPVRAWTQLQFVSQIQIDPRTRRYASEFQMALSSRQRGGFDSQPLNLPGARPHQGRGPSEGGQS
jgi:hypothetical protein